MDGTLKFALIVFAILKIFPEAESLKFIQYNKVNIDAHRLTGWRVFDVFPKIMGKGAPQCCKLIYLGFRVFVFYLYCIGGGGGGELLFLPPTPRVNSVCIFEF